MSDDTIDALNDHAWALRFQDLTQAVELSLQAHEHASATRANRRGLAESLRNLSYLHHSLSQQEAALRYGLHALQLFEHLQDTEQQIIVLNITGTTYRELGSQAEALRQHLQALRLARETEDNMGEVRAINHIGFIYMRLGDYANALRNYEQALQRAQAVQDRQGQADAHNYIAQTLHHLDDLDGALHHADLSLTAYREITHTQGEIDILLHIGEMYLAAGDDAQAFAYLEHALAGAREIGQDTLETLCLVTLGAAQQDLPYLEDALALAEDSQATEHLYRVHQALAAYYEQQGDYAQAYRHHSAFHAAREQLYQAQASHQLTGLQAAFDLDAARSTTVALKREVQERQRVEDALQQANQKLRQEINYREQLISDLDAYSHTVAHDLKAPLALVIAYSNMLLTDLKPNLTPENTDWLESINQAGMKMTQIIEELLILAGSHKQDIYSTPVDIQQTVQETQKRLGFMINQYEATIHISTPLPPAFGYTTWVEEIWTNYLSNAIKYGGRPPVITIGAERQEDGFIRYWVQDNGKGLSPEDQRQVFTQFKRLEDHEEGHGLGLSIVKRIVDKLGGKVSVTSDNVPGNGSVFSFTLRAVASRSSNTAL